MKDKNKTVEQSDEEQSSVASSRPPVPIGRRIVEINPHAQPISPLYYPQELLDRVSLPTEEDEKKK